MSTPRRPPRLPLPCSRPDTPQLQQLKAQLRATQQAISTARLEQAHIQQQVGLYEVESRPAQPSKRSTSRLRAIMTLRCSSTTICSTK